MKDRTSLTTLLNMENAIFSRDELKHRDYFIKIYIPGTRKAKNLRNKFPNAECKKLCKNKAVFF